MAQDSFVPSISGKPGIPYQISYFSNFGTPPQATSASTLTIDLLPTLTHNKYTFLGWYYDTDCTQLAEVGDEITNDITLYAGWRKEKEDPLNLTNYDLEAGTYKITIKAGGKNYIDSTWTHNITWTKEDSNISHSG